MKKFSAHYIFPITTAPIRRGTVKTDDSGKITELTDPGGNFNEEAGLECHNGIICPEFVKPSQAISIVDFVRSVPELNKLHVVSDIDFQDNRSILKLISQLQEKSISFIELVGIFTIRLAKFTDLSSVKGSIEPGKTPGLLAISGIDLKKMRLRPAYKLKKLI